jgi:hypothetical protein
MNSGELAAPASVIIHVVPRQQLNDRVIIAIAILTK